MRIFKIFDGLFYSFSRSNSGFPVIKQFIDEEQFFFHGETKQDLKLIPNLFNCVLGQYSNKKIIKKYDIY